ncbi:MAG: hypothetical protein JWM77_3421 [Rhodospirillales bacterium]|nr:hypothetical protein [Rhodospirillales bacterium]
MGPFRPDRTRKYGFDPPGLAVQRPADSYEQG